MRISDWSSDVCSSDLDGADEKRMTGLFPVRPSFERPFGVDENVRDILNVANLVHAPPDLQQRVIFGGSGVGRIEQQDVAEARAPARGKLPRSEEHTSEIQSLMRISYAVFCLKKKNT